MGFGNLPGEFWLGNDNIHLLTKDHDQKLKIELKYNGQVKYADYSTFWIDNEDQKYNLTVSGFSGSHPPGKSNTQKTLACATSSIIQQYDEFSFAKIFLQALTCLKF